MERRSALCVLVTCAGVIGVGAGCSGNKAPSADTAASAAQAGTPAAAASAPAAPSLARLAGTWKGITLPSDRDTTLETWTLDVRGDTGIVTTSDGAKTLAYDMHVVGDSIVGTVGAQNLPVGAKGKLVLAMGRFAVQVRGDSSSGTVVSRAVAKPSA
ncbi:MAG TPA: hypothetical protein VH277_05520, partial [Gemmatimonadaceae bacterium]|nr:hypothetical protein [Gemmatimonadaceae bacterium]